VQNQLNSIQSQIEQLQAQLNLLNSETTYATLTVSLREAGNQVVTPAHRRRASTRRGTTPSAASPLALSG